MKACQAETPHRKKRLEPLQWLQVYVAFDSSMECIHESAKRMLFGQWGRDRSPVATTREATVAYRIEKLDCPTKEALIRDKLAGVRGIEAMELDLAQRTLALNHAPEALTPLDAIRTVGMDAVVRPANEAPTPAVADKTHWRPLNPASRFGAMRCRSARALVARESFFCGQFLREKRNS